MIEAMVEEGKVLKQVCSALRKNKDIEQPEKKTDRFDYEVQKKATFRRQQNHP